MKTDKWTKAHWGRSGWDFMHAITFAYPERDPSPPQQDAAKSFFGALPHLLPCDECCEHCRHGMASRPPTDAVVASRETLARWLVDFHNSVNPRLGKPQVSFDEARRTYEPPQLGSGECASCGLDDESPVSDDVAVVALVILAVVLWLVAAAQHVPLAATIVLTAPLWAPAAACALR